MKIAKRCGMRRTEAEDARAVASLPGRASSARLFPQATFPPRVFQVARQRSKLMWIGSVLLVCFTASHQASADTRPAKLTEGSADRPIRPQIHTTANGVRYGLYSDGPKKPGPTLFVLCSCTVKDALDDHFAGRCGRQLLERGFLCVTIDAPCHGDQRRRDEPEGLSGWSVRTARNENFVTENNRRISAVLDDLIASKRTDARRVAICGTSRGGFLALHFAAHDKRIRCTAAFAPVTDLITLREFQEQRKNSFVKTLSLAEAVDNLAGAPVWIAIGDQDERVGTDGVIAFARKLTASSLKHKRASHVELHVLNEDRGHTLPDQVSEVAANWICRHMQ